MMPMNIGVSDEEVDLQIDGLLLSRSSYDRGSYSQEDEIEDMDYDE